MADEKQGVFISHIVQEKPVALILQKYIRDAFGSHYPVFVASDQTSIGGGRKWLEHIISNLRKAQVVLILVSEESHFKEWINFEGGFGDGSGACVVPVAIKTFTFDKLQFPLSGYNGRYIADIEGIFHDISRETGLTAEKIDAAEYRVDVLEAEASLVYQSIVVKPTFTSQEPPYLTFTISNNGNTDLDLLMFEAWVPRILTDETNWQRPNVQPLIRYEMATIEGVQHYYARYTTKDVDGNRYDLEALRSVLTPSMGELALYQPRFKMRLGDRTPEENALNVLFHLHVRNLTTVREAVMFSEIRL